MDTDTPATLAPTVWIVEGDDHEVRMIEALTASEAIEQAAGEFSDQYDAPYDEDLISVVGAFAGDSFDTDTLVFVPTTGAEDESAARAALDQV